MNEMLMPSVAISLSYVINLITFVTKGACSTSARGFADYLASSAANPTSSSETWGTIVSTIGTFDTLSPSRGTWDIPTGSNKILDSLIRKKGRIDTISPSGVTLNIVSSDSGTLDIPASSGKHLDSITNKTETWDTISSSSKTWDIISPSSETWGTISSSSGGWDTISPSSETWDAISPSSGTWDTISPSSETWDAISPSSGAWDTISPSSETWDAISPSSGAWDTISPSSETWDAISPSSGTWDTISPSSETWDAISPSSGKWDTISPSSETWDIPASSSKPLDSVISKSEPWDTLSSRGGTWDTISPSSGTWDSAASSETRGTIISKSETWDIILLNSEIWDTISFNSGTWKTVSPSSGILDIPVSSSEIRGIVASSEAWETIISKNESFDTLPSSRGPFDIISSGRETWDTLSPSRELLDTKASSVGLQHKPQTSNSADEFNSNSGEARVITSAFKDHVISSVDDIHSSQASLSVVLSYPALLSPIQLSYSTIVDTGNIAINTLSSHLHQNVNNQPIQSFMTHTSENVGYSFVSPSMAMTNFLNSPQIQDIKVMTSSVYMESDSKIVTIPTKHLAGHSDIAKIQDDSFPDAKGAQNKDNATHYNMHFYFPTPVITPSFRRSGQTHDSTLVDHDKTSFLSTQMFSIHSNMSGKPNPNPIVYKGNDFCENNMDCMSYFPGSQCINGTCVCTQNAINIDPNFDCAFPNKLFECLNDTDCISINGSKCVDGFCACDPHSKSVNFCSTSINVSFCVTSSYCNCTFAYSICENNFCRCASQFSFNENKKICEYVGELEDYVCTYDWECNIIFRGSQCWNKTCNCPFGSHENKTLQRCINTTLSDHCDEDAECQVHIPSSVCENSTCTCAKNYIKGFDSTDCRTRQINDPCFEDEDCLRGVAYSVCEGHVCKCRPLYDQHPNTTSECGRLPRSLLDPCFTKEQCQSIDNHSIRDVICLCDDGFFFMATRHACVPDPVRIGDHCDQDGACSVAIANSVCGVENQCECQFGWFADDNNTKCTNLPRKVGDRCWEDSDCRYVKNAACSPQNRCFCSYKYFRGDSDSACVQRPRILKPSIENEVWLGAICDVDNEDSCPNWNITNQRCMTEEGRTNTRCRCVPGFANVYNNGECHEIQTYLVRVNVSKETGCEEDPRIEDNEKCYTYHNFTFKKQYSNPRTGPFREMKLRMQVLGLDFAFNHTSVRDRFIASELINMTEIPEGIQFTTIIQIKADYYNVVNASVFKHAILGHLNSSKGVLGSSQLQVAPPYHHHVHVDDFDECYEWAGRLHDCSEGAWCINTYGSYMCSCLYGLYDASHDPANRPGRTCIVPMETTTQNTRCSGGTCTTKWEWVGFALVSLFLLLISFLVYEVYSRKRQLQLEAGPDYSRLRSKSTRRRRTRKSRDPRRVMSERAISRTKDELHIVDDPPGYTSTEEA